VRARAVREWENCIVYTPAQPNLHLLNLNAWLIFELCDGSQYGEIEQRYLDAVDGRVEAGEARAHLADAMARLEASGIIVRVAAQHAAVA
jgi:hypothetical protein